MVAVKCNQLEKAQGLVGRMVESRMRRIEEERVELGRRRAASKPSQWRRVRRGLRRHELTEVLLDGVLYKMRCCEVDAATLFVCQVHPSTITWATARHQPSALKCFSLGSLVSVLRNGGLLVDHGLAAHSALVTCTDEDVFNWKAMSSKGTFRMSL